MMSRTVVAAILFAAFVCPVCANPSHNESCSHAEGTCGKAQHISASLPALLVGSPADQDLFGNFDQSHYNSAAMRPAAFPSYLPDVTGNLGSSLHLPQPSLSRDPKAKPTTPFPMDALGLF